MTEHYLIQTGPVSQFITPDKDKVRKRSSLGKHQRTVFVLIIRIILPCSVWGRESGNVNADIINYGCEGVEKSEKVEFANIYYKYELSRNTV